MDLSGSLDFTSPSGLERALGWTCLGWGALDHLCESRKIIEDEGILTIPRNSGFPGCCAGLRACMHCCPGLRACAFLVLREKCCCVIIFSLAINASSVLFNTTGSWAAVHPCSMCALFKTSSSSAIQARPFLPDLQPRSAPGVRPSAAPAPVFALCSLALRDVAPPPHTDDRAPVASARSRHSDAHMWLRLYWPVALAKL
jgi:hypothetical protein